MDLPTGGACVSTKVDHIDETNAQTPRPLFQFNNLKNTASLNHLVLDFCNGVTIIESNSQACVGGGDSRIRRYAV